MINILYAFLSVLLVGIVFLDEAVDRGDKKNEKYQQREEISPEKIASLLL